MIVRNKNMSLLDYFAGQALAGIMAQIFIESDDEGHICGEPMYFCNKAEDADHAAIGAYKLAQAMLAEREKISLDTKRAES